MEAHQISNECKEVGKVVIVSLELIENMNPWNFQYLDDSQCILIFIPISRHNIHHITILELTKQFYISYLLSYDFLFCLIKSHCTKMDKFSNVYFT